MYFTDIYYLSRYQRLTFHELRDVCAFSCINSAIPTGKHRFSSATAEYLGGFTALFSTSLHCLKGIPSSPIVLLLRFKMSADERNTRRNKNNTLGSSSFPKKDVVETAESSTTLDAVMETLVKGFGDTNAKIDSLKDELNAKLEGIKLDLQKQIDNIKSEICELRSSCSSESQTIRTEVDSVCHRLDSASETVSRLEHRTELIAVGIPYVSNENLSNCVLSMSRAIGFDENKTSHIECKRLRSRNLSDGDQCFILLQFSMACLRDEFYAKYLAKRDLCLKHIGMNSDRRVFINENLTLSARAIKRAALKMRKENKLAAVTTKLGVVHVKTSSDGPPVAITSLEMLAQL